MCDRYCGIGLMALPEYLPVDVEIAEEITNKILDAAVEAIEKEYKNNRRAYNSASGIYGSIDAINRLKGEK